MINDIFESIVKRIFRGIYWFIFQIIVKLVFFYTGEIFLFLVTFGNRKPRWNYYVDAPSSKLVVFTEISTWIGIAFWVFFAWLMKNFFSP